MAATKSEETVGAARVRKILATVKVLAVEYYELTGRPLGVTGEVADYVATEHLGLTLAPPRTAGYTALRGDERILIRGRACDEESTNRQTLTKINRDAPCDTVLLVLLDKQTLKLREIHEATFAAVLNVWLVPDRKHGHAVCYELVNSKGLRSPYFPRTGFNSGLIPDFLKITHFVTIDSRITEPAKNDVPKRRTQVRQLQMQRWREKSNIPLHAASFFSDTK